MVSALSKHWWMLALRGVFAILFGVLALIWPGLALTTLVLLFGAYALVDGAAAIITAFSHRETNKSWWILALEGLVGVLAGIGTFIYPGITALILLTLIAVWAIMTGVMEIIAAVRLREEIEGEFLLGLSGLASVIFGVLMLLFPGGGALAVITVIAVYAIIFGVILIALGLRLRNTSPTVSASV